MRYPVVMAMNSVVIDPNQIFTYTDFRHLLGISDKLARKLMKAGKIIPQKAGTKYIFTGQQILDYLNGEANNR